jgi:hypothetical protein
MWLALVYNILKLFVLSGCSLCTMDSMGDNPSHHEQMQANSVLSSIIYIYIYIYIYIITSWKFEAKIQGPLPWSPFLSLYSNGMVTFSKCCGACLCRMHICISTTYDLIYCFMICHTSRLLGGDI